MAIKLGKNCKVSIASTAVGHIVGNLSYEVTDTVIDTTDRDASARTFQQLGWPTARLSLEAQYDIADTGQDALRAAMVSGAAVTVNLFPEGNTVGLPKFSGSMNIESASIVDAPTDGMILTKWSFTGAPLTESTV